MEGRKPDLRVASRSAREVQRGMAGPREKMQAGGRRTRGQTGRIVQNQLAVMRTSGQTASASNTSRRTTAGYAVANSVSESPWKMVKSGKPERMFEIKACKYEPTDRVQKVVNEALGILQKKWELNEQDPWLFALAGAKVIDHVKKECGRFLADRESDNYQFVVFQIGSCYAHALTAALKALKAPADGKYNQYYLDFDFMAQCFDFQPDEGPCKSTNRQLMLAACKKFLENELSYLAYIKEFPVQCAALKAIAKYNAASTMHRLLHFKLPSENGTLMDEKTLADVEQSRQQLMYAIESNDGNGTAGEAIDRLEKDISAGKPDTQVIRLYADLLLNRVEGLKREANNAKGAQERIFFLKDLKKLYDRVAPFIEQFQMLSNEVRSITTDLVEKIVSDCTYDLGPLKREWLDFIDDLIADRILKKECIPSYLWCREVQLLLQDEFGTAGQMEKITKVQCDQKISDMHSLLEMKKDDARLEAARMLKQLLYQHGETIKAYNLENDCMNRIDDIRARLNELLFIPLLREWRRYKKEDMPLKQAGNKVSQHLPELVQLIPYVFIVTNTKSRTQLAMIACSVWHCHLDSLSLLVSFKEKDVDILLELKRIAPDMPNPYARKALEAILIRFFTFISKNVEKGADDIPVEKIALLAQWVDDLQFIHNIAVELKGLHEAWKKANKCTTASVASDHISGAALVRPESEELLIAESKLSAPIAKTPAVKVSETSVVTTRISQAASSSQDAGWC